MCTDKKNNDKNKANLPPSHLNSFLNRGKTTESMTESSLYFQIFSLFLLTFSEKSSVTR